jgi:hypothetical protein
VFIRVHPWLIQRRQKTRRFRRRILVFRLGMGIGHDARTQIFGMRLARGGKSCYVESNMKTTLTVTQAQAQFPKICRSKKTAAITRNGEVVAFVVPRKRMADLLEQMEILSNPEAMAAINRAKAGKSARLPVSVLDEN